MASVFVFLLVLAGLWAAMPGGAEVPGHEGFHKNATTFYIHGSVNAAADEGECIKTIKGVHDLDIDDPMPYITNVKADPCRIDEPSNTKEFETTMSPTAEATIKVYLMPALDENRSLVSGAHITGKATFKITPYPPTSVAMFDHFDINVSLDANGTSMGHSGTSIEGPDAARVTDTLTNEGPIIREIEFDLGEAPEEMPHGPAVLEFTMETGFNPLTAGVPPDPDRLGGTITLLVDTDHQGSLVIPFADGPKRPEPEPEPEPTNTTATPTPTETAAPVNNTTTPTPTPTNNTSAPEEVEDDRSLPAPGFLGVLLATGALLVAVAQRRRT